MSEPSKTIENAKLVRDMARRMVMVSLSSLDKTSGGPFISTLAMATDPKGQPVFLGSRLSKHTQNLKADNRAAILVENRELHSTDQDFPRASLMGDMIPLEDDIAQQRYLRRYPHARQYLEFGDFEFYTLDIQRIYLVGGFARVGDISPEKYYCKPHLSAIEAEAIEHMNEDHRGALSRYGASYLGIDSQDWYLVGIDCEGFDMSLGTKIYRINFQQTVTNSAQLRKNFTDM